MNLALKNIELAFRRFLIKSLRSLVRTSKSPARGMDYGSCKYLFVRQDRIGDVLVSTPLFAALKNKYPNAIIDVLLSTNNHFALANDPSIRRRWIYNKQVYSSMRMMTKIRRENYDFVIDLMDNPSATSTVICLVSGARWTVGLQKDNAYAYDIVVPLLSRKDAHIVDRIAKLLIPFGIDPSREDLRVRFTIPEQAMNFSNRVFDQSGLVREKTLGINISAGHDVRFWGIDNFRKLIILLGSKYRKSQILLLSKPSHKALAEQIANGLSNVVVAPPTNSFDEFAGLIRNLGLLITPDTSAVHLAAAFSVPSVVMYVQSDKNLKIWEPYKTRSEALIADVDDLRVISPEEVFQAVLRITSKRARIQTRRPKGVVART